MLNKSFIYSKIDRSKIDYTHTLYTIIFLALHSSWSLLYVREKNLELTKK